MDAHEMKWLSDKRNECVKVGYFYPECSYYQSKSRNFALESTKNEKVIS